MLSLPCQHTDRDIVTAGKLEAAQTARVVPMRANCCVLIGRRLFYSLLISLRVLQTCSVVTLRLHYSPKLLLFKGNCASSAPCLMT